MPENFPLVENEIEKRGGLLEIKGMLKSDKVLKHFISEILEEDLGFFSSENFSEDVLTEIKIDIERLNTALIDMGENLAIEDKDYSSLEQLGTKLARISTSILGKRNKEETKNFEESDIVNKVIEKVGEDKGAPWLGDVISSAKLTNESADKEMLSSQGNLSEELKEMARKKILIDTYSVGSSLNDLGGFWAYHSDLPWKETASDRAMSSALRITNTVTAFILVKNNIQVEQAMGGGSVQRLGHMQMSFEEGEYGEVNASLEIEGQTPSELVHEASKGLLEYVFSDTSLPAKGEVSEEDALLLKNYLERPSTEIFQGIYGQALAKKVDKAVAVLLDQKGMNSLLEVEGYVDAENNLSVKAKKLRLLKVISMLDAKEISEFYEDVSKDTLPENFLNSLRSAKNNYYGN